jgi:hypothetical protein
MGLSFGHHIGSVLSRTLKYSSAEQIYKVFVLDKI